MLSEEIAAMDQCNPKLLIFKVTLVTNIHGNLDQLSFMIQFIVFVKNIFQIQFGIANVAYIYKSGALGCKVLSS